MKQIKEESPFNYIYSLYAVLAVLIVVVNFIDQCVFGSNVSKALFLFISSVQMPLLMFLNGQLCKKHLGDNKKYYYWLKYMLCSYILIKIILDILRFIFEKRFTLSLFSDPDTSWFFLAMVGYLLLAYVTEKSNRYFLFMISLAVAVGCGYVSWMDNFPLLMKTIVFFPFFVGGMIFNVKRISQIANKGCVRLLCVILLCTELLFILRYSQSLYVMREIFTGEDTYVVLGNLKSYGGIIRILVYGVNLVVMTCAMLLIPRFSCKWILQIGERFHIIYFWSIPVLYLFSQIHVYDIFNHLFGWRGGRVVWVLCGLVCVIVLSNRLFERAFSGLLCLIRKIRLIIIQPNWNVKEYILIYTVSFLAVLLIAWSPFWSLGRTFVWQYDASIQHYPWFIYFGNIIRKTIKNFLRGDFELPLFELSSGLGDDIIGLLGSNGATDPLLLFSAFVPQQYSEYLYSFLTIFRLFLAGLSFSYLCQYFKKNRFDSLIGSIVYCFCGYGIYCAMRHPYFVNPMILLPLLIVGLDKILNKERPYLFIFTICYASFCGFYHMYMMTIMIGVYGLVECFTQGLFRKPLKLFNVIGKVLGSYCLGIGMAAIVFLPAVMEFLHAGRAGTSVYNGAYGWNYYRTRVLRFISPPGSWDDMAFAAIVLLTVMLLFVSAKRLSQKILVITAVGVWMTSIGGLVMNGLQYSSNRWTFGLSLIMSYTVVEMLPELFNMTIRQKRLGLLVICVYCVSALSTSNARRSGYVLVGACFLMMTFLALTLEKGDGGVRPLGEVDVCKEENWKKLLCLVLIIFNVGVNGIYLFSPDQGNYISEFREWGDETERIAISAEQEVKSSLGDVMDGRVDSTMFAENIAITSHVPGMLLYSSTANSNILQFWDAIENCGNYLEFCIFSTDQRTIANTLLSEKYQLEAPDKKSYLPYGYQDILTTDKGNNIYRNEYALPWGYTYDKAVSYDAIESLNGIQKQEAMMQAVAIDYKTMVDNRENLVFDDYRLPYKVVCENCTWENEKLTVLQPNASVELDFSMPPHVEGYVRLSEFDINDSGLSHFDFHVISEDVIKKSRAASPLNPTAYYGRKNYLFNLGYSDDSRTKCTIVFPSKGVFQLKNIELYALPMERYREQVNALKAEPLENVKMTPNHISGTVNVSKDKFLCISIPYNGGWTARVDGEKTRILRGNYAFMVIPLKAGYHEVELSYFSPGLKMGIVISLSSISILAGIIIYRKIRREKE